MKSKSKSKIIILTVLAIGFIVTPMLIQGKSTKLALEGTEVLTLSQPIKSWMEDGIFHLIFYKEADTAGTIGGIEFTGHNEVNLHAKIDLATGNLVVNGKSSFYINWNGMEGYFYGVVNAKKVDGFLYGMFSLQGYEDYDGWKLFGDVWSIDPATNGLLGTVLIPN